MPLVFSPSKRASASLQHPLHCRNQGPPEIIPALRATDLY